MNYLIKNYKLFESNIDRIINKCKKYKIKKYIIDDDGLLTVYGDVNLDHLKLNELPLGFREVYGHFNICNSKIKTLKGSPKIIGGNFYFNNTLIKDLKYCPKKLAGDFMVIIIKI